MNKLAFLCIGILITLSVHSKIPYFFWQDSFRGTLSAHDLTDLTPHEQASLHKQVSELIALFQYDISTFDQQYKNKILSYTGIGAAVMTLAIMSYTNLQIESNYNICMRLYEEYISKNSIDLEIFDACEENLWKWTFLAGICVITHGVCRGFVEKLYDNFEEYEMSKKAIDNLKKSLLMLEESVNGPS